MGLNLNPHGRNGEETFISHLVKQSFHGTSLTLLSLLLPLSFLLLSRLCASPPPSETLISIILYIIVSFLSLSTVLSSIAGSTFIFKPPTAIAWAFVCLFQTCVSLGVEETIRSGLKPISEAGIKEEHEMMTKKILMFVGIYETMEMWGRAFVKPVVDDAVYGEERRKGGGVERVMMGMGFGLLWVGMLRMEVEPLAAMAAERGSLGKGRKWTNGFTLWLVSLVTVMAGMFRVAQVLFWPARALFQFLHRKERQEKESSVFRDDNV